MGLATRKDLRTFCDGVIDVRLDLRDGRGVDQRPDGDAILKAVANTKTVNRFVQFLREGVVDAVMDVEAIGADAGLSVVPEAIVVASQRGLIRF